MPVLALVGCAHIHVPGFIKRLQQRPHLRVKSVWDYDADRAARRAAELNAETVSDVSVIYADGEIDGVIVCSETDRHEGLVIPAAAAKKHLFIEKPLGFGADDAKRMAQAIDAAGVMFQTGYFMRGQPVHLFLKEHIAKGTFGKITRIRRFVRGDFGIVPELSLRVQGSPDLYYGRSAVASVNFITAHDGFTLRDLVSYNEKHNFANGENNRDGTNDNYSWNCGIEGETDDAAINALRQRQMKNLLTILMMSRGVPMLLMGDEIAHTKYGNNNTYCHDNALNWFNWEQVAQHADLFRFVKRLIAFRKAHPVLRGREHFHHTDMVGSGYPDISWHGTTAWQADWSASSRALAFLLCGKHAKPADDYIYVMMNAHDGGLWFTLPHLPDKRRWHHFVNTGVHSPEEITEPGSEKRLKDPQRFLMGPRSVAVLVGR